MDRLIYGGNLYLNDINCRLGLIKAKMPDLARAKEKQQIGYFSLGIPYEIEELECTFSLNGGHEHVRKEFGKEPGDYSTLFWYERIRDIRVESSQRNIGRVVMLTGLIERVEQPEVQGMKAGPTNYRFSTIVDYRDIFDGREIHRFSIQNNTLIIDGINYSEEHNQLTAANG